MEHAVTNIQCAAMSSDHKTFAYVVLIGAAYRSIAALNRGKYSYMVGQSGSGKSISSNGDRCEMKLCSGTISLKHLGEKNSS